MLNLDLMRIPDLIGSNEAASRLGVTRAYFNKLVLTGDIPVVLRTPGRTGARMFDPVEIDRIAARRRASKRAAS